MRNKDSTVKTENLNPVFDEPLKKFDKMHREMTGEEAVITSANDGKHMPGSKHELDESGLCNAVDLRRWGYDKLNEREQEWFDEQVYGIFPPELFDWVTQVLIDGEWQDKDHFHCEYDPDRKTFPVLESRKLTAEDIKQDAEDLKRDGETKDNIKKHLKKKETPIKLPIYKKSGFKRKIGGLLLAVGGILTLIPQTSIIGQGMLAIGGATETLGLGAGMMKNRKKSEDTKIDTMAILRIIADILIKLFGKKEK